MVQVKHQKIYSPLSIRKRALDYANRPEPSEENSKRKGACIGNLTDHVKSCLALDVDKSLEKIKLSAEQKEKVENTTRLVISWLFMDEQEVFGPTSRGELTPQQVNALSRWASEYKGQYPEGEWVQRRTFKDELTWVIYWAGKAWKWTVDALSIGEDLTFGDILQRYVAETIAGEDAEDYWNLSTMVSVEKAANDLPEQPIVEPVKVPESPQKGAQKAEPEFEPFAGLP